MVNFIKKTAVNVASFVWGGCIFLVYITLICVASILAWYDRIHDKLSKMAV